MWERDIEIHPVRNIGMSQETPVVKRPKAITAGNETKINNLVFAECHKPWRLLRGKQKLKTNKMHNQTKAFLGFAGVLTLAVVLAGQTSGTLAYLDSQVSAAELLAIHHQNNQGLVLGDTTSIHAAGSNVKAPDGTIYQITGSDTKRGYTSAGAFLSYGFNSWVTVLPASPADLALLSDPAGFIPPQDGKVICSDRGADKGTCYLISQAEKVGFPSAAIFKAQGYSFSKVLAGDTSFLPYHSNIQAGTEPHRAGALVSIGQTVYLVTPKGLLGISDMATLGNWGYNVSDIVVANSSDVSMPRSTAVLPPRTSADLTPIVGNSDSSFVACPTVYTPVCGSNGQTYSNTCYASSAGVSVAYSGVCQDKIPNTAVAISDLSPSTGPIFTAVKIYGTNFTPTGNTISFGGYPLGSYPKSTDGTLSFSVPISLFYPCTSTPCPQTAARVVIPGTYDVIVSNSNGISKPVSFTVTDSTTAVTVSNTQLKVLSPNGGEQWAQGSAQTVKWTASSTITNVNIFMTSYGTGCVRTDSSDSSASIVCSGQGVMYTIASNVPDTGSYNWAINSSIAAGQYLLTVSDAASGGMSDSSDAAFSVVAASTSTPAPTPAAVTINQATIYPNTQSSGSPFNITYNWSGGPTSLPQTVFVHIVDANGGPVTSSGAILFGDDHIPPIPTNQWKGTISYARTVVIPSTLPPGTYRVMVGLYDSGTGSGGTGNRMTLTAGSGVTVDTQTRYQIGQISVTAAPVGYNPNMPVPTNLIASCPAPGNMATVSWTAPSGYNTFYLRANAGLNNWASPSQIQQDTVVGNSSSFSTIPGSTYNWWVHTRDPQTGSWGPPVGSSFTCAGSTSTISIVSPASGVTWNSGTTQKIVWTAPSSVSNVNIYINSYSPEAVAQNVVVALPNVPNTGSYAWTIPTSIVTTSGTYYMVISDAGSSGLAASTNIFNIHNP